MKKKNCLTMLAALSGGIFFFGMAAKGDTLGIVKDDDGVSEGRARMIMSKDKFFIKKDIILDIDPSTVKEAQISYYCIPGIQNMKDKKVLSSKKPELKMMHFTWLVNGTEVKTAEAQELFLPKAEWHEIKFDSKLLIKGKNEIVLKYANPQPEGVTPTILWFGIDTSNSFKRSAATSDGGSTWKYDALECKSGASVPSGEYMIRLKLLVPDNEYEILKKGDDAKFNKKE